QAEDGIRDLIVTGVQTCALPISCEESASIFCARLMRRITSFGMEGIPRISRAQKMDALSSQANLAGYKAVLIAAETLAKLFPMRSEERRGGKERRPGQRRDRCKE